MRKVFIQRSSEPFDGTKGNLKADGWSCITLERSLDGEHPRIPPGNYVVKLCDHPDHGMCFELQKVRGRTAILIHSANVYVQLEGCIALGQATAIFFPDTLKCLTEPTRGITDSKETVKRFMSEMGKDDFSLEVRDP